MELSIFRVSGPLWGESTHKGQCRGALYVSFMCAWANGWANYRDARDLRRHVDHCDVTVMYSHWNDGTNNAAHNSGIAKSQHSFTCQYPFEQNLILSLIRSYFQKHLLYMTSSNGNISALLAICADEFHAQWPVTRSFDVFFDLCPNKRLSKQ